MAVVQFQIWLDVGFTALYVVLVAFLLFHFTMYVVTGRFRKSWIEGHWPEHDSAPPAAPKVMHLIHMTGMIVLGFSGMYIRFPFFDGGRELMRGTHYVAMILVSATVIARFYYAFFSKTNADWREFTIGKKDLASMLGVVKFYAYLSNEKPHVAKYNVMQKLAYDMFAVLMLVQMFSGFALLTQPILLGISPREALVGWWLGPLVGGVAMAGWWVRTFHYVVNWLFIVITTVHLYLALHLDIPCSLNFLIFRDMEVNPDAFHHGDHEAEPAHMASALEADGA